MLDSQLKSFTGCTTLKTVRRSSAELALNNFLASDDTPTRRHAELMEEMLLSRLGGVGVGVGHSCVHGATMSRRFGRFSNVQLVSMKHTPFYNTTCVQSDFITSSGLKPENVKYFICCFHTEQFKDGCRVSAPPRTRRSLPHH